jgi:GNAT superfamily N-acetyltransferase
MTELPFDTSQLHYIISTLDDEDKPKILSHLKRLSVEDRYLRFFGALKDSAIETYVNSFLDLNNGRGFGIFSIPDRKLIGFAHVSAREYEDHLVKAELGISVDSDLRGKGLAKRMMDRILVYCKANGINTLFMSCLRENKPMQHIARSAGLKLLLNADEAFAELEFSESEKKINMSHEIAYEQISIFDKAYRQNQALVNEILKI